METPRLSKQALLENFIIFLVRAPILVRSYKELFGEVEGLFYLWLLVVFWDRFLIIIVLEIADILRFLVFLSKILLLSID